MDDNGQWVSVADAARKLGVTRQAIQGRIKRGTIEHHHDNRGNPIVRIPAPPQQPVSGAIAGNAAAMPVADDATPEALRVPPGEPETIPLSAHHQMIETLQGTHREALDRQERQHREYAAMLLERVDRAEIMAEEANAGLRMLVERILAMPEPAEPWWSRLRYWFGASKRSDIGG